MIIKFYLDRVKRSTNSYEWYVIGSSGDVDTPISVSYRQVLRCMRFSDGMDGKIREIESRLDTDVTDKHLIAYIKVEA